MVHLLPGTVQALTLETKYWQHQENKDSIWVAVVINQSD